LTSGKTFSLPQRNRNHPQVKMAIKTIGSEARKEKTMSSCLKTLSCIALAALFFMSGCFSAKPEDIQAFARPWQADVTMQDYIIQPPDELTIVTSNIPELRGVSNQLGQTQVIRPDGVVSFENIGEVHVAGKTPRQVAEIIGQKLGSLYKLQGEYPIDIRVINQSKYYYIIGMVYNPGLKMFSGRESTLSAISRAVPTNLAWEEKVQVIRPAEKEGDIPKVFELNYKQITEHGNAYQNVLLQEGDIVYVPPTILASIGLTLQEIVGPVLQGGRAVQLVTTP
jgi:protein involved in polysaccharide export with SLBB domain